MTEQDKKIIESLEPLAPAVLERAYSVLNDVGKEELEKVIELRNEYIRTGVYTPLIRYKAFDLFESFKMAYYWYKKINFSELMSFKEWIFENFIF